MKENEIYIVTSYRWGEREKHSYNIGVFTKKEKAIEIADSHRDYRGGKYACVVEKCIIDNFNNNCDNHTIEVYRAKSLKY